MSIAALRINGAIYSGWLSVSVTASMCQAARSFDLRLTERWPGRTEAWRIREGDACTVELDGETVLTGWVDEFSPAYEPEAHAVRVAGRSKTADLVDCSAMVKGGQFKGYPVDAIARTLAANVGLGDIKVIAKASAGAAFPDVQINPGETCFELIERLCRLRALLACDDAAGNLVLTRAGAGGFRRAGAIRRGVNVHGASASLSQARRFSDYFVRGQQTGTDNLFGTEAAQPQAHVNDAAVRRKRPRLVIAENQGSISDFTARAHWEQRFGAAEGVVATYRLRSWRDAAGRLWSPGDLVPVEDDWLGISQDLLIKTVTYQKDDQGTAATVELVPADALTPEPVDAATAAGYPKGDAWRDVK